MLPPIAAPTHQTNRPCTHLRRLLEQAQASTRPQHPLIICQDPIIELIVNDDDEQHHLPSTTSSSSHSGSGFGSTSDLLNDITLYRPTQERAIFRIPGSAHIHSFSTTPCYCKARHSVGGPGEGRVRGVPRKTVSSDASRQALQKEDGPRNEMKKLSREKGQKGKSREMGAMDVVSIPHWLPMQSSESSNAAPPSRGAKVRTKSAQVSYHV